MQGITVETRRLLSPSRSGGEMGGRRRRFRGQFGGIRGREEESGETGHFTSGSGAPGNSKNNVI